MFSNLFEQFFERVLFEALGEDTNVLDYEFLSGGTINISAKIISDAGYYFIKWNESSNEKMFEKEANGLQRIADTHTIFTPKAFKTGKLDGKSYLLLEYIEPSRTTSDFWENFGRKLAILHSITQKSYGYESDNYIGSLVQTNTPNTNWIEFFFEHRLMAQAGLAYYNQLVGKELLKNLEKLSNRLNDILVYQPPSLIHGDLWSGNFIPYNDDVYLVDPSVYFANREIEIAFTQLFGGFDQGFYNAYFEAFPVENGFANRAEIYNLYPLLVHVNLFGNSYLSGVERTLKKYI